MTTTIYKCKYCENTFLFKEDFLAHEHRIFISDKTLPLTNYCAKFYALNFLSLEKPKIYRPLFNKFSNKLSKLFFNYSFKAIGGELRHFTLNSLSRQYLQDNIEKQTVYEAIINSRYCNRASFWKKWENLSKKEASKEYLLDLAANIFINLDFPANCGGKNWAKIADIALSYAKKEISPTIFVDTCWGLEHNSASFFDKRWKIPSCLPTLLDAGRSENTAVFYHALTEEEETLKKELLPFIPFTNMETYLTKLIYPWNVGDTVNFKELYHSSLIHSGIIKEIDNTFCSILTTDNQIALVRHFNILESHQIPDNKKIHTYVF